MGKWSIRTIYQFYSPSPCNAPDRIESCMKSTINSDDLITIWWVTTYTSNLRYIYIYIYVYTQIYICIYNQFKDRFRDSERSQIPALSPSRMAPQVGWWTSTGVPPKLLPRSRWVQGRLVQMVRQRCFISRRARGFVTYVIFCIVNIFL